MAKKNRTGPRSTSVQIGKVRTIRDGRVISTRANASPLAWSNSTSRAAGIRKKGPTLNDVLTRPSQVAPRHEPVRSSLPALAARPQSGKLVARAAAKPVSHRKTATKLNTGETHRPRSNLSLATAEREPVNRKSSLKARDLATCKKRPDSKKAANTKSGGGGSKKFIPWC